MPKRALPVLAAVMAAAFVAQPQQARTQEVVPTIRGDMNTLAAKGLLANSDEDFIKHAARAGALEIQAATLAMTKASNPGLKAFAQRLVNDHTATAQQVAQWATKKNVLLKDDDPDVKIKMDRYQSLQTKTGAAFDKEFLEHMISDHRDAIVLFSNEARNTKDAGLRTFARETLPTIRAHLKMAWDLNATSF